MFTLERPTNEVNNNYQRILKSLDEHKTELIGYVEDNGEITLTKKVSLQEYISIFNVVSDYVQQQKYYARQA